MTLLTIVRLDRCFDDPIPNGLPSLGDNLVRRRLADEL